MNNMNGFEKQDDSGFRVEAREIGNDTLLVKLSGSININHGARELRQKAREALGNNILKFGLDMSETKNIDSSITAEIASIIFLSNYRAKVSIFSANEKVKAVINNTLLSIGANENTKRSVSVSDDQNAAMRELNSKERPAAVAAGHY